MSFSVKHSKELKESLIQSMILKEESDLAYTFRRFCQQTCACLSSPEETHSCYLHRDFCWAACTDWIYFLHERAFLNQTSGRSESSYLASIAITVLIKVFDLCFFARIIAGQSSCYQIRAACSGVSSQEGFFEGRSHRCAHWKVL